MAVAIRSIPTLQGEDAERFLKETEYAEKNERKQDFGDKILLVRNFLREQGFSRQRVAFIQQFLDFG